MMARHVRELKHRSEIGEATVSGAQLEFADAVARGLSDAPRWIPSRFLYDRRGSELFERICTLPEYYLTRTEAGILADESAAIARLTGPVTMVELGAGSALKTDYLLDAYARNGHRPRYIPVDVSEAALAVAAARIERRFPRVRVSGVHGEYERYFALLSWLDHLLLVLLVSSFWYVL
jgi:L-histidine N-alpha-methyltransferase